ncbi:hypothetical protein AB0J38_45755 [Streptomyces sp. NPDC050095]|uniref:hypothetical protein n=1 Tax=unclassified Streptomyces TaxID=2593676 RepID=UPI003412336F
MSMLVDAVEIRPRVYHRTLQIGPLLFEELPAADDVVEIPGQGLTLNCSDNDFYPLVRLEHWDGPAPDPDTGVLWDYRRSFAVPLADRLCVVDLNGNVRGALPVKPGHYHVQVLCRGRDHPEALLTLKPFPPQEPHEDPLEFWVIRVWPAD